MSDGDHFSVRHDDGSITCGACKERVRTEGRDPLGYVTAAAGLGMVLVGYPSIAVMPPLNMMLIPPVFFIVAALVGHAGRTFTEAPKCSSCKRYLVYRVAQRA